MNIPATKAFLNSLSGRCRMLGAMRKTAKLGHTVAHVDAANGVPFLAVRYSKDKGFTYFDRKGNIIPSRVINSILRNF